MSNEKTGEQPSWSTRMDELDLPPDSDGSFRDRTWEKLYVRLQEKQQRPRRIFWYWAAAACLVLIGALSLPLIRHKKNAQPGGPVQPKELVETKTQPGTPIHTNAAGLGNPLVVTSPDSVLLSVTAGDARTSTAVTSPARPYPDRSSPASRTETQSALIQERNDRAKGQSGQIQERHDRVWAQQEGNRHQPVLPETPSALATEQVVSNGDHPRKTPDSINLAGIKLPDVRRKLKVVHINELEEPGAAYAPPEGMAVKPWFHLHLPVNNPPVNLVGQEQPITSSGIGITRLFKISQKK